MKQAGIQDSNKPLTVFLFLGNIGYGEVFDLFLQLFDMGD